MFKTVSLPYQIECKHCGNPILLLYATPAVCDSKIPEKRNNR